MEVNGDTMQQGVALVYAAPAWVSDRHRLDRLIQESVACQTLHRLCSVALPSCTTVAELGRLMAEGCDAASGMEADATVKSCLDRFTSAVADRLPQLMWGEYWDDRHWAEKTTTDRIIDSLVSTYVVSVEQSRDKSQLDDIAR